MTFRRSCGLFQALGLAAKPFVEGRFEQIVFIFLAEHVAHDLLREVAIDLHRHQPGQDPPRPVTAYARLGACHRAGRPSIVDGAVLQQPLDGRADRRAGVAAVGQA